MESSTKMQKWEAIKGTFQSTLLVEEWAKVEKQLGIDLERSAREDKAIQRLREVRNASDLLRMVLFYAISDWSLRLVGGWAVLMNIGYMSDVAILKRLQKCRVWLGRLIATVLKQRCTALQSIPGVRLRLMDATTVSRPGSLGADWRLHLCFDLGKMCLDEIELTDGLGGETLSRFAPQANEVRIVDGGYPSAKGMGPMLAQGAGLIVRINWRNVPVRTEDDRRFDILSWLRSVHTPSETQVWMNTPQGWFPLRLLASPLPPEQAKEARRKIRLRNEKKGHTVSQDTLYAAGFVLLLTNLPLASWSIQLIFGLYRLRWQIEIEIKRLKGLLHLDHLRAKNPELAQTYLLAKLLIALILDGLTQQVRSLQPDWFTSFERPVNVSRLTQFLLAFFAQSVCGFHSRSDLKPLLMTFTRYLCDSPRARIQHLAWGRALAEHLSFSFIPC
jgi:hypothetical protein